MIHPVYNQGVYALLQGAGLGKLKPNVVFMGYSGLWHREKVIIVLTHQLFSRGHATLHLAVSVGRLVPRFVGPSHF